MGSKTILVVDDEAFVCEALAKHLAAAGHTTYQAGTGADALVRVRGTAVDLIFLDHGLPDTDGLALLGRIKEIDPETVVILMTARSSVDQAVRAMKLGAFYYTSKPFDLDDMLLLAERALETARLRREVKTLRESHTGAFRVGDIIGESPSMLEMKALLSKLAQAPSSTVLLTGESGTGKDLAAKALHFGSPRADAPFMNITCSALADTLLESELFGYEKGAFTDARARKRGLLELASPGTVFLDEIGEMSPVLQAKLLRVLEEKTFKRVGGSEDVRIDVRIIAATHRDLMARVKEGRFREDLYFRLQVLPLHLPALRERPGDVPRLARAFIERFNGEFCKDVQGITAAGLAGLERYRWPGNVRELKNAIERAVLLADEPLLDPGAFRMLADAEAPAMDFRLPTEGLNMELHERGLVVQALERTGNNHTRAAALLGMTRDQMRYRVEKFALGPTASPTSSG